MEVRRVEVAFKGTRDYLQGADLYNVMTEGVSAEQLGNIRFTLHGFIHAASCWIYEAGSDEELSAVGDIRARCQFEEGAITRRLVLVPCSDEPLPAQRCEFEEGTIVERCVVAGDSIQLAGRSAFSFIETVVSMCKHLHRQLYPDVPGQWIFTRLEMPTGSGRREGLELRFKHNMNYRLTKTDILVDGRKVGDIFFSLLKA